MKQIMLHKCNDTWISTGSNVLKIGFCGKDRIIHTITYDDDNGFIVDGVVDKDFVFSITIEEADGIVIYELKNGETNEIMFGITNESDKALMIYLD